jgi:hypothetical protein
MLRASQTSKWWKVPQETLICLPRQLSLHTQTVAYWELEL